MKKEDIDRYLSALGRSLRKKHKGSGIRIELIIVGGASIILNYNFRQSTMDIDAYTEKLISIKESIHEVQENLTYLMIGLIQILRLPYHFQTNYVIILSIIRLLVVY